MVAVLPLQGILERDVNLWSIESSIPRVQLPRHSDIFQGLGQILLSLVPQSNVSQELLRPGRQPQLVGEPEHGVEMFQEVQNSHLTLDLVGHAEDVGIVLLEPPQPGQAGQGS